MWLIARALTPARRALVFRDRDRLLSRWIMAVLLILLRIVPVLVFAIVVNALILMLSRPRRQDLAERRRQRHRDRPSRRRAGAGRAVARRSAGAPGAAVRRRAHGC